MSEGDFLEVGISAEQGAALWPALQAATEGEAAPVSEPEPEPE